jgi:cell division topological specificity factor
MRLFKIFGRNDTSAPVARERLQILLAHERRSSGSSELITALHRDVLLAVSKHIEIDADKVEVTIHRRGPMSVLEIDIEIEADTAHSLSPSLASGKAA